MTIPVLIVSHFTHFSSTSVPFMSVVRYYWGKMSNYNQFQNTYSLAYEGEPDPSLRTNDGLSSDTITSVTSSSSSPIASPIDKAIIFGAQVIPSGLNRALHYHPRIDLKKCIFSHRIPRPSTVLLKHPQRKQQRSHCSEQRQLDRSTDSVNAPTCLNAN